MKKFTLIELIVVIAVLGILAAIIVPNISSFQSDAREVQLTADLRNIQTAADMFRVKSDSGVEDPVLATPVKITADYQLVDGVADNTGFVAETYNLIDMDDLYSEYLRKIPAYVKNTIAIAEDQVANGGDGNNSLILTEITGKVDWTKGEVLVGILEDAGKSTAIVRYISIVKNAANADQITVVRQ